MIDQAHRRLLPSDRQPITSLTQYRASGGAEGLTRALQMDAAEIVELVRDAGLRGRGGAGFPTASKWDTAMQTDGGPVYLLANGAEGEPGTFKDRYLMRMNPYAIVEGLLIAAHALGAERVYLGVKASFQRELQALRRALEEFEPETDLVRKVEIVEGPDEYLFGEETGLMEVVEGGLPLPHVFPPYMHGLFSGAYGGAAANPTVVNNVETLAHVPGIIRNGAGWFREVGGDDTPGTMIFTFTGDVARPCVEEVPLGMPLGRLIDEVAGGVAGGRRLKAVFPGLANALLPPEALDLPLGFDALRRAGTSLGSAGFIVYDDTRCMTQVAYLFSRFLYIESCNQCAPCKLGSRVITEALERLLSGAGSVRDIRQAREATTWVVNARRCYLAMSESLVIGSILDRHIADLERHVTGDCDLDHDIELPKLVDYSEDGGFTFDQTYMRKQPDWSYEPV